MPIIKERPIKRGQTFKGSACHLSDNEKADLVALEPIPLHASYAEPPEWEYSSALPEVSNEKFQGLLGAL